MILPITMVRILDGNSEIGTHLHPSKIKVKIAIFVFWTTEQRLTIDQIDQISHFFRFLSFENHNFVFHFRRFVCQKGN